MDANFLRNLGYFSVPNNQTLNPVDQSGDAAGLNSAQMQSASLWDDSALAAAGLGRTRDPSSGAQSFSLESLAPSTGGASSLNPYSSALPSPSVFSQSPRPMLTPRQRTRDGHDRKRSRLNAETTPFDSVDYWIQFDEEQQQQQQQKQQQQQQQQQQILLQQQQLQHLQRQQQQLQQLQRQQQQQESQPPPLKQQKRDNQSKDARTGTEVTNTASSSQAKVPTPQRSATITSQTVSTDQQKQDEGALDDSALEKALSDEDEGYSYSSINLADQLLKIDSAPPAEIPQREGLYSTPLSWEKPQMGLRLDSLMGLQTPILSEAEQRRLIAIAMNQGSSMGGLGASLSPNFGGYPGSLFGPGFGTASMSQISNDDVMNSLITPTTAAAAKATQTTSTAAAKLEKADKGKEKPKSADRTAHNDIERKYRTNLKDKISELRDAVPALRTIPENAVDEGGEGGEGSNQGGRAPKVSKGTVLTKATDYIHYLEKKNRAIMQQHQELSRRLQAFEQLLNATARPTFQMPNYSRTLFDPRAFC